MFTITMPKDKVSQILELGGIADLTEGNDQFLVKLTIGRKDGRLGKLVVALERFASKKHFNKFITDMFWVDGDGSPSDIECVITESESKLGEDSRLHNEFNNQWYEFEDISNEIINYLDESASDRELIDTIAYFDKSISIGEISSKLHNNDYIVLHGEDAILDYFSEDIEEAANELPYYAVIDEEAFINGRLADMAHIRQPDLLIIDDFS